MKQYADGNRREVHFQPGDLVLLKIHPNKQRSLAKHRFEKLSPRFCGPYLVLRKIGNVAYELQLPDDACVHPIFHVSLLKKAHSYSSSSLPPLPITADWECQLEPEQVLQSRFLSQTDSSGDPVMELLVKQKGHPLEDCSWETYDSIATQFPSFHLEDKANFQGGSNDRNPKPLLVYSRRPRVG